MTDIELLHTPLAMLQRRRIVAGVCALAATCLGSYLIVERSSAYRGLVSVLKQQHEFTGTEQRLREQHLEKTHRVLRQQTILRRQQRQLIQFLRAIGLTRTATAHYTEARTDEGNWWLSGSALEQRDVFLLVAHLRQLLPESVVTLQQVSGRATEVSDTAEVSFEISVQLATG